MGTLIQSLKQNLFERIELYDMVLARVLKYVQQSGVIELGKIYRTKHLFKHRYFSQGITQLDFIGGGSVYGDVPNHSGEVGLLFLCNHHDTVTQRTWQGHIPIERYDGELWCVLYNVRLWLDMDAPQVILENYKPSPYRLDKDGNFLDSLVRFEVLETYLMEMIVELDQKPCEPFEVVDMQDWRVFNK